MKKRGINMIIAILTLQVIVMSVVYIFANGK